MYKVMVNYSYFNTFLKIMVMKLNVYNIPYNLCYYACMYAVEWFDLSHIIGALHASFIAYRNLKDNIITSFYLKLIRIMRKLPNNCSQFTINWANLWKICKLLK